MAIIDLKNRKGTRRADAVPEFFSLRVAEARRFYLELNPPSSVPLVVVSGGCEHCAPDYAVHRTGFPYHGLEFVAAGRGTVKLGGKGGGTASPLRPGAVFSYAPGSAQHIATDPAQPLVKYFVDFAGRRAGQILKDCGLPPGRVAQVFAPGEVQQLFDELIRHGQRGSRASGAICVKLLECLALKIEESRGGSERDESLAMATYLRCREHIGQHSGRLRTLEQAANECGVNVSHLCRLFQRFDHQTPYQYLTRLKMNRAAEQLHRPGRLVKQVAEAAGYPDAFQFSRIFKRVFGVSPEAFRRLH